MRIHILIFLISSQLQARTIQVMSYNVENLFDAKHDIVKNIDKNDWTFLPKNTVGKSDACLKERSKHHRKECLSTDWTDKKVDLKISQISNVVRKTGPLPDFLGLGEVENSNVVGQLAKKLGYTKFEITESPDERGVDVALLYKNTADIKKISRAEHIVPVDYATRNILEVEFLINQKYPLTIFVNHWPSLANPDSWRIKAAEVLARRTEEILKIKPNMAILAMGDFNTIDSNSPHPFKTVLFKNDLFKDVAQTFTEDKKIDKKMKNSMASGTYYFAPKNEWNYLDHFFVNKVLMDGKGIELVVKSFEINSPSFLNFNLKKKVYEGEQRNIKMITVPKHFNPNGTTDESIGYSDHYAILVKLEYPDKQISKKKRNNIKDTSKFLGKS